MDEQEWLSDVLTVCRRALARLRAHAAPENESLENDLAKYADELERRLGGGYGE
jgi:hypothetical protein